MPGADTVPSFASLAGLRALEGRCDLLLCDVFGVLHDAHRTFPAALDALGRFRGAGGTVVLVSNAAEPGPGLVRTLAARAIEGVFDACVTSADVARAMVRERGTNAILHIGPRRDAVMFDGLSVSLVDAEAADALVCSGYPATDDDLDPILDRAVRRDLPMLCTNPDTCLALGPTVLRFAGLVAERYRARGGRVIETGKPGAAIYDRALAAAAAAAGRDFAASSIVGLGDTAALDVAGALARGFGAIHIAATDTAEPCAPAGMMPRYRMPALIW